MKKIIFLDFDGVLQIDKHTNPWRGNAKLSEGYNDRDKYGLLFDFECTKRLQQLIEETGAEVVISSSWRYAGLDVMLDMWKERLLPGKMLDIISIDDSLPEISRGAYIQEWLNLHPCDAYVIIDDVDDMLDAQQNNLVLTNYKSGFQKDELAAAILILNKGL